MADFERLKFLVNVLVNRFINNRRAAAYRWPSGHNVFELLFSLLKRRHIALCQLPVRGPWREICILYWPRAERILLLLKGILLWNDTVRRRGVVVLRRVVRRASHWGRLRPVVWHEAVLNVLKLPEVSFFRFNLHYQLLAPELVTLLLYFYAQLF